MRFILTTLFFGYFFLGNAQNPYSDLHNRFDTLYALGHLPGFGISLFSADSVYYEGYFGKAYIEKNTAYSEKTVQRIGSISKTFIGIALLQLIEEGKCSLLSPVNEVLPFAVHHPKFPNKPITIEHLVTHTSGIIDPEPWYFNASAYFVEPNFLSNNALSKDYRKVFKKWANNKPSSVTDFCKMAFSKRKVRKKAFGSQEPGERFEYTNLGACLAAAIVETLTGQSFSEYTKTHILNPYGMHHAAWTPKEIEPQYLAASYETPKTVRIPNYEDISYPEGGLHTNIPELRLYAQKMMKAAKGKSEILEEKSCQLLFEPRLTETQKDEKMLRRGENRSVFWTVAESGMISHSGGYLGCSAFLIFHPEKNMGFVLSTNKLIEEDADAAKEFVAILRTGIGMF